MNVEILGDAERIFSTASVSTTLKASTSVTASSILDSLFSEIDSLQLYAGIHAKYFRCHRLLSRRFPCAIYYRVARKTVRVYAVLDCRRHPSVAGRRLK